MKANQLKNNIPNDVVIWRYMSFNRFKQLIESKQIWFARIDQYSDFVEATMTELDQLREFEEMKNQGAPELSGATTWFNRYTAWMAWFASCWAEYDRECNLLWRSYGTTQNSDENDFKIAIKTTAGNLRSALPKGKNFIVERVQYIDYRNTSIFTDPNGTDHSRVIFHKR